MTAVESQDKRENNESSADGFMASESMLTIADGGANWKYEKDSEIFSKQLVKDIFKLHHENPARLLKKILKNAVELQKD